MDKLNLKGNFFGGVTAAIIALPLALAFGVASGLGATAGIYGAIILGFFAAALGGTPTQISGPTGPMTVVIAASILTLHNDINAIAMMIILAGIFQIALGFLHVGRWVRYIPYPVISGFMSGIGIIIIVLQINPMLGVSGESSIIQILFTLPSTIAHTQLNPLLIALSTLATMFFTPNSVSRVIPAPLIALVVLTPLSVYLGLDVSTIGEIPTTLPELIVPSFDIELLRHIIPLAITLALLGTIDTLLTSIVADSMTNTKHNSDRELIGQGVGNTLVGLFGALPGAGATMRTVINAKSGGTNRLSGMIHAITLLLIVLFFAPFAAQIPMALLAGILIKVGVDILDYRFLKVSKTAPKYDVVVMVTVFFFTLFVDLITAVGVGITLSSLLIVYRISKETNIRTIKEKEHHLDVEFGEDVRIIKIEGAFFFGSTTTFELEVNKILDIKTLIIDCYAIPFIDVTAIFTLKDLVTKLQDAGISVIIIAKKPIQHQIMKLNHNHILDGVIFHESLQFVKL